MKKMFITLFFIPLTPFVGGVGNCIGSCQAENVDIPKPVNWSDVVPVYSSYYDYSTNRLYIYGGMLSSIVNVVVTYHGMAVLSDIVTPDSLPAIYDFTGSASGAYHVTVSVGTTILCDFNFEKS